MRNPNLLTEVFEGYAEAQRALARNAARIETEADPRRPGRTAYRITGATRGAVQGSIETQMRRTEARGGYATFEHPRLMPDGVWQALGEVVVKPSVPA